MVEEMTKKGLHQSRCSHLLLHIVSDCEEMSCLQELTPRGNWAKRQPNSRRFFEMR